MLRDIDILLLSAEEGHIIGWTKQYQETVEDTSSAVLSSASASQPAASSLTPDVQQMIQVSLLPEFC